MTLRLVSCILALWAFVLPASAGDSFTIPVEGEILPGWQQADGSRVIGLRMRLAPGWKTYWRSPGDAGIPPQIDWSGSRNLGAARLEWPTPEVFLTAGMQTVGYRGDVVLPVVIALRDAGAPLALKAQLDIGVCSDICVPHRMHLSAVITDTNTRPTPAIAAALASRPFSGKEAGLRSARCTLSPAEEGVQIEARLSLPSTGGAEVVIIEPGQPDLWMSETEVSRQGDDLRATGEILSVNGGPVAINRSDIILTILGEDHAVEVRGCAD